MISCTRALFETIVSQTSEGICFTDQDGNILLVNSQLCEITGYSEALMLTRKLYDLASPNQVRQINQAIASGETDFFDIVLIDPDQKARSAQVALKPLRLENSDYLVAVFRHAPEVRVTAPVEISADSHLEAILEAADSVGFVTTTVAGSQSVFTAFSPGAELIFGHRSTDLLGKSISEVNLSTDDRLFPDIETALKDPREGYSGEIQLKRKSGEAFLAMVKIHALYDDDGYMYGLLTVVMDISIQKAAQIELRNQSALLASIFRATPVGIGLVKERVLQRVNDQICQIVGYQADELIGRNARMLYVNDEDYTYVGEEKYRQIKKFGTGTVETRWLHRNGTIRDVLLSSTPLNPKNWSEGVTFSALDITAKKKAERELIDMHERFRVFMDNIPGCAFIKDTESRLLYMNKFMLEHVGSEEWLVKQASEYLPADRAEEICAQDREVHADGNKHVVEEIPFKSGNLHWFNTVKFTIPRADRPTLLGGISLDVTEQKRADERRAELEAQMQHAQKLESLGVLAGGIAHDFNNLLVGILGNADLALNYLSPESPARDVIEDLSVATKRAAELTRQMLAYSGRGKFEIKRIDLAVLIREISHLLEASISKKAILKYDFCDSTPVIEADASQVRQIIMNLITNASEAMEDKDGIISIATGSIDCINARASCTHFQGTVEKGLCAFIEVSDTGVGMEEETISKVFDPFFTTKFAGRGLGLAAVLGIVRSHNGAIKVTSEPGRGTTFRILLPSVREQATEPTVKSEVDVRTPIGPATVLLVDDEEIVRSVGKKILSKFDVTVDEARDGREAVEIFTQNPGKYDCVILDLMMPRMDGEECFKALREIDDTVLIILSSGFTTQDISTRFDDRHVAGFIEKPYQLTDFVSIVRKVLARK
jgi:PAS domain S-box-containing protein